MKRFDYRKGPGPAHRPVPDLCAAAGESWNGNGLRGDVSNAIKFEQKDFAIFNPIQAEHFYDKKIMEEKVEF